MLVMWLVACSSGKSSSGGGGGSAGTAASEGGGSIASGGAESSSGGVAGTAAGSGGATAGAAGIELGTGGASAGSGGAATAAGGAAAGSAGMLPGTGGASAGGAGAPAGSGGATAGSAGTTPGAGGAAAGSGGAAPGVGGAAAGSAGAAAGSAGAVSGTGGAAPASGGAGGAPVACDETCHFVRADATGASDGSDWTNAWTELPSSLERGHRYYVADGPYPGYAFDDAASGTATITVQKATPADHGSEVGWDPTYGDGTAQFGPLSVTGPYTTIDGKPGRGIEAVAAFEGDAVSVSGDFVTLRSLDVNGDFGTDATDHHDQGACTGLGISGSNVTVEDCEIHDVADDGVSVSGVTGLRFVGNTVHALHACGTDGDCGPCYNGHSDGIETYNVKQSEFVGNFIYDVRSTATFFFGNWADTLGEGPSEYCEEILLANNIFYAPEVGLVAYLQDVAGIDVFQNVFWGVRQGSYGGLSIGPNVTGLRLYNNVILSINTAHTGGAFDAGEHDSDYNLFGVSLGQWTDGPNSLVAADPGFTGIPDLNGAAVTDPTPEDFTPLASSPCVDAGYVGGGGITLPDADFFGALRDADPDLGAIEAQ